MRNSHVLAKPLRFPGCAARAAEHLPGLVLAVIEVPKRKEKLKKVDQNNDPGSRG